MASSVRNVIVSTSPGLERMLAEELKTTIGLYNTSLHILPGTGVVCSTAAEIKGDIAGASLPMWKTCLLSRFAESVKVRLVEPTFCQWEKHLTEISTSAPWKNFIPLHAPIPEFKVKTNKSRLFHPLHVAKVLNEVLTQKRSNANHNRLNSTETSEGAEPTDLTASPAVTVQLNEDELEVLVDAEGGLNRRYRQGQLSRAALAGAVIKSECLTTPNSVVWDPFCGQGDLILEAASIASGQPTGSPSLPYPFTMYPTHAPESFRELIESLTLRPLPHARTIRLIGSDTNVTEANEALATLIETAPRLITSQSGIAPQVRFTDQPKMQLAETLQGQAMIVTVLPDKMDKKAMLEFVNVLKLKWKGVYVFAARTSKFRTASGLDWRPELRVTCQQGRIYELLRLCL